jgi:glutathione synthase/RimK-type ligase-like ATP-grasp enzyme
MKSKIAFATNQEWAHLTPDDRLAVAELTRNGIEVVPAIWSEPQDWSRFDAVIVRSTWRYWLDYVKFLEWFDLLERSGVPVWNPVPMLRWNANKTYLRELAAEGIPVVPTIWVEPGDFKKIQRISDDEIWSDHFAGVAEVIVKPVISGDSFQTHRLQANEIASFPQHFEEIWKSGPAMVQPFLKSVVEEGEYSFLFFGGEFSHVALKNAASGDYRVQSNFGGTSHGAQPKRSDIEAAEDIIRKLQQGLGHRFKQPPLYARVDMLRNHGSLQLVELEVLEPSLYLGDHPGAAALFAEKVRSQLKLK